MEPYGNLSGDSGVLAFKLGDDCIEIQFKFHGIRRKAC